MKTAKKALLLSLCAIMLVAATVMGTLAYLSDTDKVDNTFTVGKIEITLDEAKTNEDGKLLDKDGNVITNLEDSPRVQQNEYKIVPGCNYHKDPTVHVQAGSEKSILYITVENQMAPVVDNEFIEAQMLDYGWEDTGLTKDGMKVYYRLCDATTEVTHFPVFTGIRADMAADEADLAEVDGKHIIVNAYAVQQAGWSEDLGPVTRPLTGKALAVAAWEGSFGAPEIA